LTVVGKIAKRSAGNWVNWQAGHWPDLFLTPASSPPAPSQTTQRIARVVPSAADEVRHERCDDEHQRAHQMQPERRLDGAREASAIFTHVAN
jgi:hypothetical protein